jgi:hypothetical protein
LIIGPEGSGKRELTDRILRFYEVADENRKIVVARLKGLACTNDRDALTTLARQLGMLTSTDNYNISIEAMQAHFQVLLLSYRFSTFGVDLPHVTR